MASWLKVLLTALAGFSSGATATSATDPSDGRAALIVGAVTAASAVAGLFVRKPGDPPPIK